MRSVVSSLVAYFVLRDSQRQRYFLSAASTRDQCETTEAKDENSFFLCCLKWRLTVAASISNENFDSQQSTLLVCVSVWFSKPKMLGAKCGAFTSLVTCKRRQIERTKWRTFCRVRMCVLGIKSVIFTAFFARNTLFSHVILFSCVFFRF